VGEEQIMMEKLRRTRDLREKGENGRRTRHDF
jgi:hypothetical protein